MEIKNTEKDSITDKLNKLDKGAETDKFKEKLDDYCNEKNNCEGLEGKKIENFGNTDKLNKPDKSTETNKFKEKLDDYCNEKNSHEDLKGKKAEDNNITNKSNELKKNQELMSVENSNNFKINLQLFGNKNGDGSKYTDLEVNQSKGNSPEKKSENNGTSDVKKNKGLVDVADNYEYHNYEHDGKLYKEASGRLGIPGEVVDHRDRSEQRKISSGTGDDAGHLIGSQFGASGGPENLSPQNWRANECGTYKQLENDWARKLKNETDIDVKVTDITRKGEDRPFMRKVEWTETDKDGNKIDKELYFANTHTPESRDKQNIPSTVEGTEKGKLIEVDFSTGKRKES